MATTFTLRQLAAASIAQGVVPPYWKFNNEIDTTTVEGFNDFELEETIKRNALGVRMVLPLILQLNEPDAEEWTLPYEPMISITGNSIITRRQVAKAQTMGSIKERWVQDDYSITIEGILMSNNKKYPLDDVKKLTEYCQASSIKVYNPLLEVFGIHRIVIESWEIPFTQGAINQTYQLKCYSDTTYQLLLSQDDLKN
jgi:hypothetical protein